MRFTIFQYNPTVQGGGLSPLGAAGTRRELNRLRRKLSADVPRGQMVTYDFGRWESLQ